MIFKHFHLFKQRLELPTPLTYVSAITGQKKIKAKKFPLLSNSIRQNRWSVPPSMVACCASDHLKKSTWQITANGPAPTISPPSKR